MPPAPHRTVLRLLKRGLAVLEQAQAVVIAALMAIDSWRKRCRSQGGFPRTRPPAETVAGSELQLYTYGEDLYSDMLDAIEQAEAYVLFETFIWKGDDVGQQFKDAVQRAGISLLLYHDAMVHAKTATIDGIWSTIGTTNLDRLSMVGNFEVNVECYDRTLAQQMEQIFANDSGNTRQSCLDGQRRPLLEKLAEALSIPLWPLL